MTLTGRQGNPSLGLASVLLLTGLAWWQLAGGGLWGIFVALVLVAALSVFGWNVGRLTSR